MSNQHPPAGWGSSQPPNAFQPPAGAPQYGVPAPQQPPSSSVKQGATTVGPFTLRELFVFIATGILLLCSFLPLIGGDMPEYVTIWYPFWPLGLVGVLLPLVAAALILLRRLVPRTRWRAGSLSVDQFASVVAIVAAATYLATLAIISAVGAAIADAFGGFVHVVITPGIGAWLGFLFALVLVALTTFGPLIPPFSAEFRSRAQVPAHPVARPAAPVARRERSQQSPQGPGEPFGYAPAGQAPFAPSGQPGTQAPAQAAWPYAPQAAETAPYAPPARTDAAEAPEDIEATVLRTPGSGEQHGPEDSAADTTALDTAAVPDSPQAEPGHAAKTEQSIPAAPVAADAADEFDEDAAPADASEMTAGPVSAASHVNAGSEGGRANPPASSTPFWVWSPVPRDVVDAASGAPLFAIGPTAWALAVEDRGTELVIRNDDGRIGVLRDIDGLTRG